VSRHPLQTAPAHTAKLQVGVRRPDEGPELGGDLFSLLLRVRFGDEETTLWCFPLQSPQVWYQPVSQLYCETEWTHCWNHFSSVYSDDHLRFPLHDIRRRQLRHVGYPLAGRPGQAKDHQQAPGVVVLRRFELPTQRFCIFQRNRLCKCRRVRQRPAAKKARHLHIRRDVDVQRLGHRRPRYPVSMGRRG
jgi:hypothetical protein